MARVNLTAKRIKEFSLPEGAPLAFLWDTEVPGLAVRATVGAKAYIFQSRLNGRSFRITIGDVRVWQIEQAKMEARRLQTLVDQGVDPRQEKADRREAQEIAWREQVRRDVTFREAWQAYVDARRDKWGAAHLYDHQRVVHEGGAAYRRGTGTTIAGSLAVFLEHRLDALTPGMLVEWAKQEAGIRPTQAALAFRLFRGFCNWAEEEEAYAGLIPPAACASKKVRENVAKVKPKKDHLQVEQLPAWFAGVRGIPNPVIAAFLQAGLLTGARREELAGLRWTDVDFQWLSLRIGDKIEGERVIPLTPYVSHLLEALPRRNEWVFSSLTSETGRLQEPRIAHNQALHEAGLPNLTIHGLRRSFASLSEWIEVPVGVVAQIQGHKPSATAEKHYKQRPLDLLRMWHSRIERWMLEKGDIAFGENSGAQMQKAG